MQQIRDNEKGGLHRITALAAAEMATIPNLTISESKLTKSWAQTNQSLQLDEWAYKEYFAGAIIDKKTGESLEYQKLIKRKETRETWFRSLANEIGHLAQEIRNIKGTRDGHNILCAKIWNSKGKTERSDLCWPEVTELTVIMTLARQPVT